MGRICLVVFTLILAFTVGVSSVEAENEKTAKVTVDTLNVRSGPSLTNSVVGQVHKSHSYPIIGQSGDWLEINLGSGKSGWIAGWFATVITEGYKKQFIESNVNNLNIRSGPGLDYKILGKLQPGTTYTLIAEQNNWSYFDYYGKKAWVASWLVNKSERTIGKTIQTPSENEEVKRDSSTKEDTKKTETNKPKEVKASLLNMRTGPAISYSIVDQLPKGTQVTEVYLDGNWSKVTLTNGTKGWVSSKYLADSNKKVEKKYVSLLYNYTNLRRGPDTSYSVITQGNKGEQFEVVSKSGKWYQIKLKNGTTAYVADWIVTTTSTLINTPNFGQLNGKTIVIDAGHGGYDSGAVGIGSKILEKVYTLKVADQLAEKLKSNGAKVILTRDDDSYITLSQRVSLSHTYNADAFLSLHFDSSKYTSATGTSVFYYSGTDSRLANKVLPELVSKTGQRNRGTKFGNYQVLRTNSQPSILIELGFLSNYWEEAMITSSRYQSNATTGITNGLIAYFK